MVVRKSHADYGSKKDRKLTMVSDNRFKKKDRNVVNNFYKGLQNTGDFHSAPKAVRRVRDDFIPYKGLHAPLPVAPREYKTNAVVRKAKGMADKRLERLEKRNKRQPQKKWKTHTKNRKMGEEPVVKTKKKDPPPRYIQKLDLDLGKLTRAESNKATRTAKVGKLHEENRRMNTPVDVDDSDMSYDEDFIEESPTLRRGGDFVANGTHVRNDVFTPINPPHTDAPIPRQMPSSNVPMDFAPVFGNMDVDLKDYTVDQLHALTPYGAMMNQMSASQISEILDKTSSATPDGRALFASRPPPKRNYNEPQRRFVVTPGGEHLYL